MLAAYDFESLQLSLLSLERTVSQHEKIIIILNGAMSYSSAITERIARIWAAKNPVYRFVVKPLCAGQAAYFAITEILTNYAPLRDVKYICKIDDDVIPLKTDWIENLAKNYTDLSSFGEVGFVTGLINNNCWGFKEIVRLSGNDQVYKQMFNYKTVCDTQGCREIEAGEIDNGYCGTIWQYPFLGWWIHQLTSLAIPHFLEMSASLGTVEIPENIPYSIGCIFMKKEDWLDMDPVLHGTNFDEILLYLSLRSRRLKNWSIMNEPMIHLFYHNQRMVNKDIIEDVSISLSNYYKDTSFLNIRRMSETELGITAHEKTAHLVEDLAKKTAIILENIDLNLNEG